MPSKTDQLLEQVAELRAEVQSLHARLEKLENVASGPAPHPAVNAETVVVIASALAAYFGVKPHIRQIRLVRSGSWAHQGRATIHASHLMP